MRFNLKRQVDTRITVVVVIIVLAVVQAAWWKGLIWKPTPRLGPRGGGGSGGRPTEELLMGREDVKVDTFAGAPDPGSEDGIGRKARFDGPVGMAIDAADNIILADSRNNRIRKISPTGRVETVAGGEAGFADGPVSVAKFTLPTGIDVLPDGTILVADTGNNRIRAIKSGVVSTIAGGEAGDLDGAGNTARFNAPVSVAHVKGSADILVADALNKKVRTIGPGRQVSSHPVSTGTPMCIADVGGPLITLVDVGAIVNKGSSKTIIAGSTRIPLKKPMAVCPSKSGFYISSVEHGALFEVSEAITEVVAGRVGASGSFRGFQDGDGNRASFGVIAGIAYDGKNHIYVSDLSNNAIRRITLPD